MDGPHPSMVMCFAFEFAEIKLWSARTKACRLAATLFELLYEALGLKPEPRRDGLCERTCSPESLLPGMPVARVDYEHQQAF
ncbi:hypothetical protein OIU79_004116 [Salix purpurea]|uniref:Uncharacterized protein n=1 Tax=Salix purpurea TaxID=77065 RepID=A0A9Q0Z993_SALPP|nr:hypothetical protein OIU79_004116 [Salix purpurea]